MAASYTEAVVRAIVKKTSAAIERTGTDKLVMAGGVAANSHLRARLAEIAKKNKREIHIPDLSLCGDNAAMIAVAGYFEYKCGNLSDSSLNASALDSI